MTFKEYVLAIYESRIRANRRISRILYEELLSVTSFLPASASNKERCWYVLNNQKTILLCKTCEINKVPFNKDKKIPRIFCSSGCVSKNKEIKQKKINTIQQQYGITQKEHLAQMSLKFQQKYGVSNPSNVGDFNDKKREAYYNKDKQEKDRISEQQRQTNQLLYNVDNCSSHIEFKTRRTDTVTERYGVANVFQSEEIKEKIRTQYQHTYGNNISFQPQVHLTNDIIGKLHDRDFLLEQHTVFQKPLNQIAEELGVGHKTIHNYMLRHGIPVQRFSFSFFETQVCEFLINQLNVDPRLIQLNVRPLGNFELDIYLPDKKIAIECDGVYWHSELQGNKTKTYHLEKTINCERAGIRLYHIFENEWNERREQWKAILTSGVGVNRRVGARTVKVLKIEKQLALNFTETYHLQGGHLRPTKTARYYGLLDNNQEMVGCVIFDKSRFNYNFEWELLRMCFKSNVTVVGGVSKMCSMFERDVNPSSLISYADRRFSTGTGYAAAGFSRGKDSDPGYHYVYQGKLHNRLKFQKHKLQKLLTNFNPKLSEWDNMKNNDYDRIWDCGNQIWYKKYENVRI